MYFLFKMGIFHCYVCLPEGRCYVQIVVCAFVWHCMTYLERSTENFLADWLKLTKMPHLWPCQVTISVLIYSVGIFGFIQGKSLPTNPWMESSWGCPLVTWARYFSAHWCGPCRQFTPELAKWYAAVKNLQRKEVREQERFQFSLQHLRANKGNGCANNMKADDKKEDMFFRENPRISAQCIGLNTWGWWTIHCMSKSPSMVCIYDTILGIS